MTDFKDDDWKITPSHNIKSVEDFLNDTSSLIDENTSDNFLKKENSLEDSLSDWGISVPEIISGDESDDEIEDLKADQEKTSILDHLGTSIVDEQKGNESSFPSEDDLGYPDEFIGQTSGETTGEYELGAENKINNLESRSLFDEVTSTHEWKVEPSEELENVHPLSQEEPESSKDESGIELNQGIETDSMEVTSVDDPSLPNENDLEYPDLDAIIKETSGENSETESSDLSEIHSTQLEEGKEIKSMLDGISTDDLPEDYKPRSQLTSLEELNNELDSFQAETDPSFEVTQEMKRELREEIPSDVEADDFWAIDEFPSISGKLESSGKEGTKASDIKADFFNDSSEEDADGQFKMKPSSSLSSINISDVGGGSSSQVPQNINVDEIVEKVKEALAPQLEEVVKKLFSQKIEQVAWEVIPDLAENVIKKEVEEIAKQVYMSTNELKKE